MYLSKNIEVNGMLLQFKFSNFRSFVDETVFDMTATTIKEHKYSLVKHNGVDILPVAAIYGANASGKSSFFMAMKRMKTVVVDRFLASEISNENNEKSYSIPFMFDENIKKEPSSYEVSLLIGNYEYRYGFSCTNYKVLSEYLYRKKLSKNKTIEKLIFERFPETYPQKVILGTVNKATRDEIEYCSSMATDKILILTDIGLRRKNEELCRVFEWFLAIEVFSNDYHEMLSKGNVCESLLGDVLFDDDRCDNNFIKQYKKFIRDIDPSISDIVPSTRLDGNGDKVTIAKTRHILNGVNYDVSLNAESEGTNKLMFIAIVVFTALERNVPIFIDELDSKLHPLLLRKIIQMFTNKEINTNGAQLIFSAHNIINLDSSDLRRDEIWFVEKEHHKSTMYSLVDFEDEDGSVRSDLSYGKHYLSGRFGAVPFQD